MHKRYGRTRRGIGRPRLALLATERRASMAHARPSNVERPSSSVGDDAVAALVAAGVVATEAVAAVSAVPMSRGGDLRAVVLGKTEFRGSRRIIQEDMQISFNTMAYAASQQKEREMGREDGNEGGKKEGWIVARKSAHSYPLCIQSYPPAPTTRSLSSHLHAPAKASGGLTARP